MPSFIQRSFAGGEIAPELGARADMVKYMTGLKTCRNFIVQKHGGVANAPGTRFIAEVRNSSKGRLVPFGSYALEFTPGFMRAYINGAQVTSGGVPDEIATPYDNDTKISTFQYARNSNALTIAQSATAPQNITISASFFAIATAPQLPSISAPTNVALTDGGSSSATDTNDLIYKVTSITDKRAEESIAAESSLLTKTGELSPDNWVGIVWDRVDGAEEYNIYRSENGSDFYFIGIAKQPDPGDSGAFRDKGQIPDETVSPPDVETIFTGPVGYPSVVTYFQQRRVFAASVEDPDKIWMSRTGVYNNFSTSTPVRSDDAVIFSIAGRESNNVRHIVNIGKMVVLTNDGEWLASGDGAGAVTPTSINLQQQGYSGASTLMPVLVGNTALFVQAKGSIVRNLVYQFETDGYSGNDLTVFANHLFRDYTIVDWAYQQTPDSVIWAVRSDGVLLGLTYLPEHDVWGWHRHDTDGFYESVVCIDEGEEDAVYFIVRRTINGQTKRYVERLEKRIENGIDDFYVHSGLSLDGRNTDDTNLLTVTGGQYEATLTTTDATFSASDIGNGVKIFYNTDDEIRFVITGYTDPQTVTVSTSKDVTSISGNSYSEWAFAYDEFSGLDHLEGKVVSVLADGMVIFNGDPNDERASDFTVTSGAITLDNPYSVVHIGLPYESDFETLRLENTGGETIVNRKKIINKAGLMVESSRGINAGTDFDNLRPLKQRDVSDGYGGQLPKTEFYEISMPANYELPGRICVRQKDPLPLTILSIVGTGVVGGN